MVNVNVRYTNDNGYLLLVGGFTVPVDADENHIDKPSESVVMMDLNEEHVAYEGDSDISELTEDHKTLLEGVLSLFSVDQFEEGFFLLPNHDEPIVAPVLIGESRGWAQIENAPTEHHVWNNDNEEWELQTLLSDIQYEYRVAIDREVGEFRRKIITVAPGQELVYMTKGTQARAFRNAGYPEADIADYPFIKAEADAVGMSYAELADFVIQLDQQWSVVGSTLEALRMGTKGQINGAEDPAEMVDIFNSFKSHLEAIAAQL